MERSVYSAIYSGIPVYESIIQGISVMRRMGDSYMNATQILKLAGIVKSQRTKILEQEVISGIHEKVQGGHAKCQGTWIPLETSRALARKYGVESVLSPILDFIPGAYPVAAQPIAPRKSGPRKASADFSAVDKISAPKDGTVTPPNGQEISPNFTSTLAERTPARSRVASSATIEQSPLRAPPVAFHIAQEHTPKRANEQQIFVSNSFDENQTQNQFLASVHSRRNLGTDLPSDINPGELSNYEFTDVPVIKHSSPAQRRKDILLHIFTKQDDALSVAVLFELLRKEKPEVGFFVDYSLDIHKTTPLHWAAVCARLNLSKILIARGANTSAARTGGGTPLMSAIASPCAYKDRSFPQLLELLSPSLLVRDVHNQTVLHRVAHLSAFRSKRQISKYYMQCIAKFIVDKKDSTGVSYASFVDQCNSDGDSALHLAVRYRNHALIHTLLTLGASKLVQNHEGHTPFSLCGSDPRMRKLLDSLPEAEYDDYLDAPTTPLSDIWLDSDDAQTENSMSKTLEPAELNLSRKRSSSTLSTSGFDHASETQIASTMAYLSASKIYVSELKHQKERFEVILKYASKIETSLKKDISNPNPPPVKESKPYASAVHSMPVAEDGDRATKKAKIEVGDPALLQSQKATLQETRLSCQLTRLETLVKTSQDNQIDLIEKLERIKEERLLKDDRYSRMIAMICKESPELMGEILEKLSEQFDY